MASIRTLVLELLRKWKPKNVVAQLERFQDDFDDLIYALKKIRFLFSSRTLLVNQKYCQVL